MLQKRKPARVRENVAGVKDRYIGAKGTLPLTPLLQSYENKNKIVIWSFQESPTQKSGIWPDAWSEPNMLSWTLEEVARYSGRSHQMFLVSLLFKNLTTPLSEFR